MTSIDPGADVEFQSADRHIAVRIALAGPVADDWLARYRELALAGEVPADVETAPGRAWMVVRLPGGSGQQEVLAVLDAAFALMAQAEDAAGPLVPVRTEATVRAWLAGKVGSEGRRQAAGTSAWRRSGLESEAWWPMAMTLAVALAVPLLLPPRFGLDLRWVVPALEGLLLLAVLVADRSDGHSRLTGRALSLTLVTVLVGDAAFLTGRLIADLVAGGPETNNAADLLKIGFLVWLYSIITCALLYWALDGGGPQARAAGMAEFPDLAFPEQLNPGVARPGWRPAFTDYLYLGFTNSTAFSPTDVMPLARWAKLVMTAQAVCSLAILGLVIARAVNILR